MNKKIFIKLFKYLTGSKLNHIETIFKKYNVYKLFDVLDIYLVLKGYRKTCFGQLDLRKIDVVDFSKTFNLRVYEIRNDKINMYSHIITTSKDKKIEQIAKGYEKYTYGIIPTKQDNKFYKYQQLVGKVLEYITPSPSTKRKNEEAKKINDITIFFKIFYDKRHIEGDYAQGLMGKIECKHMMKLKNNMLKMNKILKELSPKFALYVEMKPN